MQLVRLFILGILKRRGSAHGYRIHRDLVEWRVETWTVIRPGSIYYALTQMEKLEFIRQIPAIPGQKSGPVKAEYLLTTAGEKEFIGLLSAALTSSNLVELSAGIAFMEYLPRQEVIDLLHRRLEAQKQLSVFLGALPTQAIPSTPAKHPELIRIWADTYADAAVSTKKLITAIQSGKYVFKNKEVEK